MTLPCIRPPPRRSSFRKHSAMISWRTSRGCPGTPKSERSGRRQANHRYPLRLHPGELEHLNRQAALADLSREKILRSLVAGIELHPRPCTHHAELLRQVSGLCNNANQLARVANTYGVADMSMIAEMTRLAREVWKEVKEKW